MKKFLAVLLCLSLFVGLASVALSDTFELALVTDLGTIDDKSFNQGSWEGLVAFAEAQGLTYKYYQPSEQATEAYLDGIALAVEAGAKAIVTPGFLFEVPIYIAQDMYPDVNFILIDGSPNDGDWSKGFPTARIEANVLGVFYQEEQSGFLAGYAAVKDGYTKLGFMGGMAVPAVVRFGYGFVQGAEYAAAEMGIDGLVVNYHYTGGFSPTPEAQALAAAWYNDGIEVIFAAGGGVNFSVFAAAEANDGKVIGVDVDQSVESPTVITSAMKGLKASVEQALEAMYAGAFPGGTNWNLGASNDGIGLPMATSRFNTFSQADYDAIYAKLVDGSIEILRDTDSDGAGNLPVTLVKVVEVI